MVGDDIALGIKASMMIVTERLAPLLEPGRQRRRPIAVVQADRSRARW